MMFEPGGSRIIATNNRNRNMLLCMLQRVPDAHHPWWADGLAPFGVALLFGVGNTVILYAEDCPYETLPGYAKNDNQPPAV